MNAVAKPSLDDRVLAIIRDLAPCTWPLLLGVLKIDREPLDLSLARLQRWGVIIQTAVGFDLRGKKLPMIADGNYSKYQPLPEEIDEEDTGPGKRCPKCRQTHPLSHFTKNKYTKDGLQAWCKCCQAEDHRKRRLRGQPK